MNNTMRKIFAVAGVLLLSLALASCSRPAATVNDRKIDMKTLDQFVNERAADHRQRNVAIDMSRMREVVLQELIAQILILEEAEKRGIHPTDEEVTKEMASVKGAAGDEALSQALKDRGMTMDTFRTRVKDQLTLAKFSLDLVKDEEISEEEMREYYRNSPKPFMQPARVLMRMMEFSSEPEAQAVREEMEKKGIAFDEMAARIAQEKRAVVSEYGWVPPEFFSPPIAAALKDLAAGEQGGPFQGQKGFFLIRVKDRQKERVSSYEEVRDSVRSLLLDQRRQAAVAHWIAERKKASKIVIHLK